MEKILIVDDDPDIVRLVSYNLEQAGYEVLTAGSGRRALDLAHAVGPDLIVLDLMLPDIDGIDVCRKLRGREELRRIPVIMLSARGEESDRILGFELGADDYVTKPFSPRELVLRVRSILRREEPSEVESLRVGNIQLLPATRQCFLGEVPVTLTVKEFELLMELMRADGCVLTREYLLENVWGYHEDASSRTLDTHVRRLREKLGDGAHLLQTVRGVGFRMTEPVRR